MASNASGGISHNNDPQATTPLMDGNRPTPHKPGGGYTTYNNPITSGNSVHQRKSYPDYSNYEDAIATYDCGPFLRRIGFISTHARAIGTATRPGQLWFVKDCCGVVCAVFTWLLIFYAEYVVLFVILYPSPQIYHSAINAVVFQTFAFLAICSHSKAMLTDPVSIARSSVHGHSMVTTTTVSSPVAQYYTHIFSSSRLGGRGIVTTTLSF